MFGNRQTLAFKKGPTGQSASLQSLANHGASPVGAQGWADGEEDDQNQPVWIYQE